jgi:hypothetical protein
MSVFNWIWDFGQDSKIDKLTERVEILEEWIRYYEQRGRPQETLRESGPKTNQTGQQD